MKKLIIFFCLILIMCCIACGKTETYTQTTEETEQQSYSAVPSEDYDYTVYNSIIPVPVESSAISYLGYSDLYRALLVTFLESGKSYIYYDVPRSEYEDFINADSIGKYYNRYIKGQYQSVRIEDE